jgi:hypothetical protein
MPPTPTISAVASGRCTTSPLSDGLFFHSRRSCCAAGESQRAVKQWLKAGHHAAERLAHVEAISHFERGLVVLAALPEDQVRDGLEIELQLARGLSLFTAHGFMATDAAHVYGRARELAERWGDSHHLFMAVYGLCQSAAGSGKILECRKLSNRLQQLTADGQNDELLLQAHHSAWTTCLYAGTPVEAREHFAFICSITGSTFAAKRSALPCWKRCRDAAPACTFTGMNKTTMLSAGARRSDGRQRGAPGRSGGAAG